MINTDERDNIGDETVAATDAVMAAAEQSDDAAMIALAKSVEFNGENRGHIVFVDAHGNVRELRLSKRQMEIIGVVLMSGRELLVLPEHGYNVLQLIAPQLYNALIMMTSALASDTNNEGLNDNAQTVAIDVAQQRVKAAYFAAGEIGLLASIAAANHKQLHALAHVLDATDPLSIDYAKSDAAGVKRRVAEVVAANDAGAETTQPQQSEQAA